MKSDKLTYPETIIIDGTEHNGKRNMSKGQILIPYTDPPNVSVGDVIVQKSDKKDVYLKVTATSFIEDGSFGVGTDHPHLLTLKVANTSIPPQASKKTSSTADVSSAPGEQNIDRQKGTKIKTISMQHFMKHVVKNWGEAPTSTEKPIPQDASVDRAASDETSALPSAEKKPDATRSHLKKRILGRDQGEAEGQPAGIHKYVEDLSRGINADIGRKDFFEMASTGKAGAAGSKMEVRLLKSEDELKTVAPILLQLRPHFDLNELVIRIKIQQKRGYKLAYVVSGETVLCVAGFVTGYKLAWGKHIYIDDLVTSAEYRSAGAGRVLMEWFKTYAKENGYEAIHLDSSVLRFPAHKFYLESGFHIGSHHFSINLKN